MEQIGKPVNKNRQIWIWTGVGALFICALYSLHSILMPFLTGMLVAYALNPAVARFEKWGIPRAVGTSLMIFGVFLVLGLLLCIAIPFIHTELLRLAYHVPQYGARIRNGLEPFLKDAALYIKPEDLALLRNVGSTYMGDIITWSVRLFARALTSGMAIANLISLIIITPLIAFYCLRDWNRILGTIDRWLPRPYEAKIKALFIEINTTIGHFAKGQALVCLMVGIYYSVALTLVQLEFSLIIGPIIGVIAFIPYLGALVGFMVSIGIAFSQFPEWSSIGIVAAVFMVGQLLEGYILIPYYIGDRIGLHPVWVIFALLAGGVLYGFVGILFALPMAAAVSVLVRQGLKVYGSSPYYLGPKIS